MNRRTFLSAAIAAALTPKLPAPTGFITFPAPTANWGVITGFSIGNGLEVLMGEFPATILCNAADEFEVGGYITVEVES